MGVIPFGEAFSFARSAPAPGIWHGFLAIAPSRTAVFMTARRNRYDWAIEVFPPVPRRAAAYHSRTTGVVIATYQPDEPTARKTSGAATP